MKPTTVKPTTTKLITILRRGRNWQSVENELNFDDDPPTFKDFLISAMDKADMTPARLFERADIDRSLGYRILRGERRPNRNALIRIAFVLRFDINEAQHLLTVGDQANLYPRKRRDAAIMFMLEKRVSLEEAHVKLEAMGEAGLYTGE